MHLLSIILFAKVHILIVCMHVYDCHPSLSKFKFRLAVYYLVWYHSPLESLAMRMKGCLQYINKCRQLEYMYQHLSSH